MTPSPVTQARGLALALGQATDTLATLARQQVAAAQALTAAVEKVDFAELEAQILADALQAAKEADTGAWGRGRLSGLPWWSGVAWRGSQAALDAFVAGPRAGTPVDMVQVFSPANPPPGLCDTWDAIAGGAGDSPETLDGTLTWTRGSQQGRLIWETLRDMPVVYTVRPVPLEASNEDGRNPAVWQELARGDHDHVFRRLGRRMACLDQKHGRTAPLVLELGHEMNGDWYPWSIQNAAAFFPAGWARIVTALREGYLAEAGRHCPYSFLFRPARTVLAGGVRLDRFLPCPSTWDAIGLTAHDNVPQTTAVAPQAAWQATERMEGWLLLAELAERHRRAVLFAEWSPYPPESVSPPGNPQAEAFVASMWDFCQQHSRLVAGECYFDRVACGLTDRPAWSATKAYRERWGQP